MASSFIKFKEHGFWIYDSMMEVALSYILKVSKNELEGNEWGKSFIRNLEDNALGYFSSYMNLELDEYMFDDSRRDLLVVALKKTMAYLNEKYEQSIPVEDLNSFIKDAELQTRWVKSLEKDRVIKVIEYLISLVRGEIKTTTSDPIDYEF